MKDEPNDIAELRRRVAKAKELSEFSKFALDFLPATLDNRGNHVLGAFLTGVLQEYDKVVNENNELKYQISELQLQVGDWKDVAEEQQTIIDAQQTLMSKDLTYPEFY